MIAWLMEYGATIVIGLVLFAVVAGIVIKIAKDKKSGKSSCGCGCKGCAMAEHCHSKK